MDNPSSDNGELKWWRVLRGKRERDLEKYQLFLEPKGGARGSQYGQGAVPWEKEAKLAQMDADSSAH